VTHFLQLEREFSIATRQIAPGSDFFRTLLDRMPCEVGHRNIDDDEA
jgi:hypothetical protein